jgi:tryptophan halogenase
MKDLRIRNIVVVGGGSAGWMAAACFARLLNSPDIKIQVIESDAIGIVGVGEATIPHILYFNRLLGLDEDDFIRTTNATFKLGIEFVNWGRDGHRYIHPFGSYGMNMEGLHFHHFYMRQAKSGNAPHVDAYNLQVLASRANKFQRPELKMQGSPLQTISYAFHFDAGLYAKFLREFSLARGVTRTEGKITSVQQNAESGFVESVTLENGQLIAGDLFIDCSGFRGLLIEQTLKSGFDDWGNYLPNDRAIARACRSAGEPTPYTRATAKTAGWQWRIPLQSRIGNGHVYCSEFISDEAALASLNADLDGEPLTEPNFLKFRAGIRRKPWNKNVISLGLASGFMEPLESTSIHLIQSAIARLMANFPDKSFNQPDIDYYNRRTRLEWEQVRDFIILHYCATERDDTPYWNYCRNMKIPDTLAERLAIYRENARLYRHDSELFSETSWFAVMHGQFILPSRYHPVADIMPQAEFEARMARLADVTQSCLDVMPTHQAFIDRHCKANV